MADENLLTLEEAEGLLRWYTDPRTIRNLDDDATPQGLVERLVPALRTVLAFYDDEELTGELVEYQVRVESLEQQLASMREREKELIKALEWIASWSFGDDKYAEQITRRARAALSRSNGNPEAKVNNAGK